MLEVIKKGTENKTADTVMPLYKLWHIYNWNSAGEEQPKLLLSEEAKLFGKLNKKWQLYWMTILRSTYKIKYGIEKWARKSFSSEHPNNLTGRRFKGD